MGMRIALLLSVLVAGCLAADSPFSYQAQQNWTGSCNSNTGRQSPINIIGVDVQEDPSLTALQYSEGWSMPVTDGTFENIGSTVKFTISDSSTPLTVTTPGGSYTFRQFHLHWGTADDTGSEHRFDDDQSEVEIHFVTNRGSGDSLEYAVVGVFADVSDDAISGGWAKLDAGQIVSTSSSIDIANMTVGGMIPSTEDYYVYEGSLTTPPCSEIVTFYLYRDRITVPRAYLSSLRNLQNADTNPIGPNFRDVQEVNGRVVRLFDSGATVTTVSVLTMLVMALATFIM